MSGTLGVTKLLKYDFEFDVFWKNINVSFEKVNCIRQFIYWLSGVKLSENFAVKYMVYQFKSTSVNTIMCIKET